MKSPCYINVNGKYGCGAYERPDYRTLCELLAAMDRLGIYQTVAYHSNACDLHPVFGNRMLMDDIRNTPGARERVLPALAINPAMTSGKGEMASLLDCLKNRQAGCLILFPRTNRYRLIEIVRVLECIREYRPVILIDVVEMDTVVGIEDLIDISHRFPELSFVIKQVMWWQFSRVFDALKRSDNIYVDTSWLHMRDSIKILRDHIGVNRILFGVGLKAHSGAAIAGLSYANLPQAELDAIAHANFTALIADREIRENIIKNRRHIDHHIKNRFWTEFIKGHGVRNTLVIDAHTHIGPFNRGWYLTDHEIEGQVQALEADMARFGITRIISNPETALFGQPIDGNRMVEQALVGKEDRFQGYLIFNPFYSEEYTDALLNEFFSRKYFIGFKILPEYLSVDIADERYKPAFAYADKHCLPILIHTWEGQFGTAMQTAAVAAQYPNATFIFGHTGGGTEGRHQCESIAQDPRYGNCFFEFCGSFTTDVEWPNTLQKIDYHRVLYGSDTIVHDIAWEMGRLLSFDLPDEQITAILGQNMQRILDRVKERP